MQEKSLFAQELLNDHKLEYFTIKERHDNKEIENIEFTYGIEIVKKDDFSIKDSCCVKNVTFSNEEINNLADILHRNSVTPISLREVVEDYIIR